MYSLFEVSLLLLLTLHLTLSFVVNPVDTSASWSFDPNSDVGPPKWSSIQTNTTNECDGLEQSPIDITIPGPCTATNRTFELNPGNCTLGDLGFDINPYTLEISFPNKCAPYARFDDSGDMYRAQQVIYKSRSGHTIEGKRFPGEFRIVHVGPTRMAIISVMVNIESETKWEGFDDTLAKFSELSYTGYDFCSSGSVPIGLAPTIETTLLVNPYDIIPENSGYFNYRGSVTAPPCSQIVDWFIADKQLQLSLIEYVTLVGNYLSYINPETCEFGTAASPSGDNFRPVQALNGRRVAYICSALGSAK